MVQFSVTQRRYVMAHFNIGDVVALESNPKVPMTVISWTDGSERAVACKWFDSYNQINYAEFQNEVLVIVKE